MNSKINDKEIWYDFKYNPEYQISTFGKIKTKSNQDVNEIIIDNKPYVELSINNKLIKYPVEYLMLVHFFNYNNNVLIKHINNNLFDNSLTNLILDDISNINKYDFILNLENEKWKDINGYEKLYQISSLGRVKILPQVKKDKKFKYNFPEYSSIITPIIDNNFYNTVYLKKNNKQKSFRVDFLVADQFLTKSINNNYLEHLDHNRLNDNLNNLVWIDYNNSYESFFPESVIYKLNSSKTLFYNNINEAAKELNVTVNTIKTLCNRKGIKSNKGLNCIWANQKLKKKKTSKRNKTKGNNFELEIINKLKSIGYNGCVSSRSQSKRTDDNKIDIIDLNNELPINIQTKYTLNTPNYFDIRSSCTDKSKPFTIIWKKTASSGSISPGIVAIIPVDFLYELLKLYKTDIYGKL